MIFSKLPNKAVTTPEVAVLVQGMRSEKAFAVTKTGDIKMSGKFLARASALSLAFVLAACGGDENSTPLAGGSGTGGNNGGTGNGDGAQTAVLELGSGSGSSFQSGRIQASATELSFGGSARLEFNVVDARTGNTIYNAEPTSAAISSLCQNADFDRLITSNSGSFTFNYNAACEGSDTITARLDNGASATVVLSVASAQVGELEFVSVVPDSIALSGNSNASRPSVSEVSFRLTANGGEPITTGKEVRFRLSTTVGGISLSRESVETDGNGVATTRVNAGSVPGVVSVTASHTTDSGATIQTTSAPISISAAIPDQDSFSISIEENFLPNARNYDGIEVPITIRAADRNNNRVRDAVVNFLTNAGSVQSECTLVDGACSIEWISQNPRSSDGVVLILARTVGEESFRDVNSDGQYTFGTDQFNTVADDLGEAFLDRNQNGVYDPGEEYFDYNNNGQYDPPNGIYNGTACVTEENCTSSLLEITQTGKLFLASDDIMITFTTPVAPGLVCAQVAGMFWNDDLGTTVAGPPPGGTDVSFATTNGTLVDPTSFTSTTSYRTTPIELCVTVEADGTSSTGTFTVEVTPPAPFNGDPFTLQAPITD
ncbi:MULTISPECIES: hypothetical protein [Marinobacter]|uniref:hypothetical protein n=1 Tax=Marinobacter TaxID=2742 RepID=UPI001107DBC9|nr:hypothetical protein [Marinobacter shengliensis]WBU42007.1 hypothetical protein PBN92_03645 [Marinobacter alkaliphilus]